MVIYIRKLMQLRSKKLILLLLACCITFIYGIFKLQNDFTIVKNLLKINTGNFKFHMVLRNKYKKIYINSTHIDENTSEDKLKVSKPNINVINLLRNATITCNVSRPDFPDLQFDNIYWQTLNTTNGTFKLFRAFYDHRYQFVASIRIIAMIDRFEIQNVSTYCQFWFDKIEKPMISKIIEYQLIWNDYWGWDESSMPFLITCPYDFDKYQIVPEGVSLVNNNCEQAGNYLKILNNRPVKNGVKKPFVVCVRDFKFDNQEIVLRLVEWIELLRLLGADKIFLYQFHVTGDIRKIFDYYEHNGILETVKINYPENVPLDRWPNQLVSLNDCFYRNIYLYDYVVILDTNEVIMPQNSDDMSWLDMVKRIKHNQTKDEFYGSYTFQNIFFYEELPLSRDWHPDIPHYLHMLQYIIRPTNHSEPGNYVKSIYNTELVKSVHNNYPISCLYTSDFCMLEVNIEFGHLANYRPVCTEEYITCNYYKNHTIQDKTVWKYKDELIKQSMKAINMLELTINKSD